jgi:tetratricopeptide (TPR) repeat protein
MSYNVKDLNKKFKEAQDCLKTSFFSLKFKPDYLGAVTSFTDVAKGYRFLKMWNESLKAFEEAIKCNKQLLESWAEGVNWNEMAEIYFLELKDYDKGWQCLKNASLSIKIAGKFHSGIKLYIDMVNKLQEKNEWKLCLMILTEAYKDCADQTHDELIRISLEEVLNKLIDIQCQLERYQDSVNLLEEYITIQRTIKEEPRHKITKNYIKLGMLRIIIDELYMAEKIIDSMFEVYDSSCGDDIEDLRKLCKSFKECNKKDFSFLITYAFVYYQNNLLKALRQTFSKLENSRQIAGNSNANVSNIRPVINLPSNINLDDQISLGNTEADSKFEGEGEIGLSENPNNPPENNPADEFL